MGRSEERREQGGRQGGMGEVERDVSFVWLVIQVCMYYIAELFTLQFGRQHSGPNGVQSTGGDVTTGNC